MLVLTRKLQQQIQIGDNITVTVLRVKGQAVRIGIEAPRDIRVLRSELPNAVRAKSTSTEPKTAEPLASKPPTGLTERSRSHRERSDNSEATHAANWLETLGQRPQPCSIVQGRIPVASRASLDCSTERPGSVSPRPMRTPR